MGELNLCKCGALKLTVLSTCVSCWTDTLLAEAREESNIMNRFTPTTLRGLAGSDGLYPSKVVSNLFGVRHRLLVEAIASLPCTLEFKMDNYKLGEYFEDGNGAYKHTFNMTLGGMILLCGEYAGNPIANTINREFCDIYCGMERELASDVGMVLR